MWKKALIYSLPSLLFLLGVVWRIRITRWEQSIVPGLDLLSTPVLWTIVIILSLSYLVAAYFSVKKTWAAGRKKYAVIQATVLSLFVILVICLEILL